MENRQSSLRQTLIIRGSRFQHTYLFTIIEKIEQAPDKKKDLRALSKYKQYIWIKQFRTLKRNGLNTNFKYPQNLTGYVKKYIVILYPQISFAIEATSNCISKI